MNLDLTIISIVEGIIEFLPISSTAHLIITSKLLSIDTHDSFIKFYLLIIQFGALLAGIVLFSKRILKDKNNFINVTISFIPSAIIGFIFYKMFKKLLEGNMILLAIMSLLGGLIFIYLEKVFIKNRSLKSEKGFGRENITKKDAFIIGIAQAIAIIPGVSRSGATIIAGVFRGIKKSVIFEYTFMLALPTLGSAVLYDAYKSRDLLYHLSSWNVLIFGCIISFVVAFATLYFLEKHISKISLTSFGWYRILLAVVVFFSLTFNVDSSKISNDSLVKEVNNEKVEISTTTNSLPEISFLPEKIYPGDPVFISINASSTVKNILIDQKEIPVFSYNNKDSGFFAIPFEDKKMSKEIAITLENGMLLKKTIEISPREVIERPLGIPEKLGGNTKEAGKTLVNNLSKENQEINSIKSENRKLWESSFSFPINPFFITDEYGYNRDTVGYVIVHKGMDLRAPLDTKIYAMNDGVVRLSKTFTVYGETVAIDHGLGVSTFYMHLSKLNVKEGDFVKKGDLIGFSGQSGYAESPHLHISIKINGVSIDPKTFLSFFNVI